MFYIIFLLIGIDGLIHFRSVGRPPVVKLKNTIPVGQHFHRFDHHERFIKCAQCPRFNESGVMGANPHDVPSQAGVHSVPFGVNEPSPEEARIMF